MHCVVMTTLCIVVVVVMVTVVDISVGGVTDHMN